MSSHYITLHLTTKKRGLYITLTRLNRGGGERDGKLKWKWRESGKGGGLILSGQSEPAKLYHFRMGKHIELIIIIMSMWGCCQL